MNLKELKSVEEGKKEFTCEKHGKYISNYLVLQNGKIVNEGCPLCEKEELEQEEEAKREKQQERLKELNIEPEFYEKTFDDFVVKSESQQKALNAIKQLVAEKKGKVVLVGGNGTGKTMLASIAVKELGGKIYTMYEISTMIRQSYTIKATKSELEIVNELATIPLLVIDEIGRTKNSETEQNWLSYILDKRHCRNLPFILISNTHFRKFCKNGGCPMCFENFVDNDVLSRLHQNTKVVMIEAPDYRINKDK